MKLDMNKPFGVVSGEHQARFEQDGRMFNADGNELDAAASSPEPATQQTPVTAAVDSPKNSKAKGKPGRKAAIVKPVAIPDVPDAVAETPPESVSPIDEQLAAQGA